MASLPDLRRLAPKGVIIEHDKEAGSYAAVCAPGTVFGYPLPGTHEIVAWYENDTPAGARERLAFDLSDAETEPCSLSDCEWCHPQENE